MPIYEYRCNSCGHVFDALQKMSDAPLTDCPECQESALKKLLSAPKFRLKGAGWYETDFKTGNKRNIADGAGASAGKSNETNSTDSAKSAETKSTDPKSTGSKSTGSKSTSPKSAGPKTAASE